MYVLWRKLGNTQKTVVCVSRLASTNRHRSGGLRASIVESIVEVNGSPSRPSRNVEGREVGKAH